MRGCHITHASYQKYARGFPRGKPSSFSAETAALYSRQNNRTRSLQRTAIFERDTPAIKS